MACRLAGAQVTIWTNAKILLTAPLRTNFSEILVEIYILLFNKIHFKMAGIPSRAQYVKRLHNLDYFTDATQSKYEVGNLSSHKSLSTVISMDQTVLLELTGEVAWMSQVLLTCQLLSTYFSRK